MSKINSSAILQTEILPYVRKPHRYAGKELNRIVKEDAEVRIAVGFPDLYEIGMSWLGLQILYHVLNSADTSIAAERVFLPEEDAISRFRETGLPLTTLETHFPLNEVDLVGISLSYEMAIPGMLEMLDLGKIPIRFDQRNEHHPIVIAGGPVAYNPEPFVDFVDLVFIGEAEEGFPEIARIILKGKRSDWSRSKVLEEISKVEGVYNPHSFSVIEQPNGRLIASIDGEIPTKPIVHGATVPELKPEYYTDKPLVPQMEITFNRLSLEVMRGCTRGCRFCQAGTLYRPVREREIEDIVRQAEANIAATGYNEISLTSLSTSDYTPLPELINGLQKAFSGKGISLAFPSLRPDSFTKEMAMAMPDGRKGGITFAPEAGTQRLRDIINKNSSESDLLRASGLAFSEGYNSIKLYFMIGLPGETYEDLDGIANLARKVAKLRVKGHQKVSVSISPFAPKPHTPFERFPQEDVESVREKLKYLSEKFKKHPARYSGHDPVSALYETALARGDRRMSKVLEKVWKDGGMLEAWNDRFNPERWEKAFTASGYDVKDFVNGFADGEPLPWGHITKGVTEKFQKKEMERANQGVETPDCREGKCTGCGLSKFINTSSGVCNSYPEQVAPPEEAKPKRTLETDVAIRARILYKRGEGLRWTGHLDLVRLWDRYIRMAEIPISFSQGFHPHPRISFSPPLSVGLLSEEEYVDLDLNKSLSSEALLERLRYFAPDGLYPAGVVTFEEKQKSLASEIEKVDYKFYIDDEGHFKEKLQAFLSVDRFEIARLKKQKWKQVNIREFVESVEPLEKGFWKLRLRVVNGATARLDELGKAWEVSDFGLGSKTSRLAMWINRDDTWLSPVDTITTAISRSKELFNEEGIGN